MRSVFAGGNGRPEGSKEWEERELLTTVNASVGEEKKETARMERSIVRKIMM